jgi:glyoxylase-like metal-dependent hydrolase (beta-lactamase superfamily II)
MAEVKVLIKGYAKEEERGWLACSTATLIKSNGKLIISDPGCNREKLLEALNKEGLEPENIDFVFLTHGHIDHSLLAGIFKNAKFVTFENLMYDKDLQLEFEDDVLGPDTKIIKTPGHSAEHISLGVDTDKGKYIIAGDVFWWVDGEEQVVDINKEDTAHPTELNMKELKKSRKKILEIADYIIPGHGNIFEVKK